MEAKKTNQDLRNELDNAELLLIRLQFMNEAITDHIFQSSNEESKLDLGNAINTFADCIRMYAGRIEQSINNLYEIVKGGGE